MAKFIIVDKHTVRTGLEGFESLLKKHPTLGKYEQHQRSNVEKWITAEKKRRDDDYRDKNTQAGALNRRLDAD